MLISAETLARDVGTYTILDATVSFPKPRFDGDYRPESGYAAWRGAHLPGSVHADLLGDLSAGHPTLHFSRPTPDELARALAELGVAPGADIVVYSATKHIDGQGRVLGGAILGSNKIIMEHVFPFLRTAGPSLSPFNAWVILKGLETLELRMRAHCANARAGGKWGRDTTFTGRG